MNRNSFITKILEYINCDDAVISSRRSVMNLIWGNYDKSNWFPILNSDGIPLFVAIGLSIDVDCRFKRIFVIEDEYGFLLSLQSMDKDIFDRLNAKIIHIVLNESRDKYNLKKIASPLGYDCSFRITKYESIEKILKHLPDFNRIFIEACVYKDRRSDNTIHTVLPFDIVRKFRQYKA